ncbi:hypothetical protein Cgig2_031690 [Carnegiea gigantea]|uniref:F-box domain-containing protein n=1 Tax=Carnegiea gigantea TaxID=171969 RepID=A0A9Q1KRR6_9CARY|nr:hypothetical protein Cgig2_031690 [Carnegiea gigantea]
MRRDLAMEEQKRKIQCCLPPAGPAPWLVYTHGSSRKRKMQTFCAVSSSPLHTECFKSIRQLCGKEIFSSSGEWLLLCDLDDSKIFSLYTSSPLNALDDEVLIACCLVIPSCGHGDDNFNIFSFADGVAFSYQSSRNNNSWVVQSTELLGQRVHVRNVVTCNGIIYGHAPVGNSGGDSDFVIIEINDNCSDLDGPGPLTLRSLKVKHADAGFMYAGHSKHFLESCGRVYMVVLHVRNPETRTVCAVNIWELDLSLMKWVRGFKVPHGAGGILVTVNPEYYGMTVALYQYNSEECSLASLLPCPNLPPASCPPTWVVSQCQRFAVEGAHKCNDKKVGYVVQSCDAIHYQGQEENEGAERFLLCKLPHDLILRVAQQLHLFDYLNFRATCKLLNYVAPPARWRTNNSYPLLMFFESDDPLCRLMDPCRSDSCYMVIPETFGGIVFMEFCKVGWLLLCTNRGDCLEFFNPFTGIRGKFPSFKVLNLPNFDRVTAAILARCSEIFICYVTFGDEMWHICSFPQHEPEFLPGVSRPVYYKEAFYFLDRRGFLVLFKLINGEGKWHVYGKPEIPYGYHCSSHLVDCDGELLSIFIGEVGEWIRVFKLEQPKMKWVPVKSLGNHTLFVSSSSSFAAVVMEREMRNRIYLARWNGNGVLFYSLDTGKYGTLKGEDWMEDLSGTKEQARCCWI